MEYTDSVFQYIKRKKEDRKRQMQQNAVLLDEKKKNEKKKEKKKNRKEKQPILVNAPKSRPVSMGGGSAYKLEQPLRSHIGYAPIPAFIQRLGSFVQRQANVVSALPELKEEKHRKKRRRARVEKENSIIIAEASVKTADIPAFSEEFKISEIDDKLARIAQSVKAGKVVVGGQYCSKAFRKSGSILMGNFDPMVVVPESMIGECSEYRTGAKLLKKINRVGDGDSPQHRSSISPDDDDIKELQLVLSKPEAMPLGPKSSSIQSVKSAQSSKSNKRKLAEVKPMKSKSMKLK